MVIRDLSETDVESVVALSHLFDDEALVDATHRFLDDAGHHLLVAYDGETAVGFVTGVEMTHPDKGTEMFLYELGVDEPAQGRGVGRCLVHALADKARSLRCTGMWVLTDEDNVAALRAYEAAGGVDPSPHTMISWTFERVAPYVERVTGIEPA